MGMTVSANTLRNWLKKGKVYLDKLVESLKEVALEKDSVVNCDETWCKVRKYDHYKKCYIWVLVNKAESYPIDNNAAERAVRPLTTQRNSMLHFGSDEGAKMAATYHSIISTVKLQGRSAWDYLGKFFVNIFNGCRDFFNLRPGNIGLATCQ